MERQYVASISYGKDSLAMLHVITDVLHKPLDRIITAEVWATDTIPADLPPMVAFKEKADQIIKERCGIEVEHLYATDKDGEKLTYEKIFYRHRKKSMHDYKLVGVYGFPYLRGPWCNNLLKTDAIKKITRECKGAVSYIGVAADETARAERHGKKKDTEMPLVEAGWTEDMCRQWCEENELLSPIYSNSTRGGCWFCHNQGIDQLRILRNEYPELWSLLLKWDNDAPDYAKFKPGRTVHDYENRLKMEEEGFFNFGKFCWKSLENAQMNIDQFL